jgi:anaerobic magnesium-protoporphyrin IX monomethyl ester cyclase
MRADQGVRLPPELWARAAQSGLRRLLVGVESGSDEMLKRIRKDIRISQVFEAAHKMAAHDIAGHFPFIVGFPDESDDSIRATIDVAKRLRAISPQFRTPIFYFKPYPGSEIVRDAVARGYRLPQSLKAWSEFDYVDGDRGPWVSREKFKLIERFKFFSELAALRAPRGASLLQRFAEYRCRRDEYRWPVEMLFTRWLLPEQRLS